MTYPNRKNFQAGRNLKRSIATLYCTDKETFAYLSIIHFMVKHAREMPGVMTKMSKRALLWGVQSS